MMLVGQPENQYLLTAVQLGVFGLAALLALFAAQWRLAALLATRTETDIARGLVIFMVVGCLFNSFLLDHTEALFYAWLSGWLISGGHLSRGRRATTKWFCTNQGNSAAPTESTPS
jgi:O-antigen ligase